MRVHGGCFINILWAISPKYAMQCHIHSDPAALLELCHWNYLKCDPAALIDLWNSYTDTWQGVGWGEWDGWGWGEQKWQQPRLQPVIVTSLLHVTHTPKTELGHLWGPHWPYESTRDGLAAQANSQHNWNRSRKCTRFVHKFIVNQQSLH